MKAFTFFILTVLFLTGCKNSRKEVIIDNQKLLYDSTQTKDKSFKVILITTLELDNSIEDEYLKSFYLIADKDTLLLNLQNSIHEKKYKRTMEYSTVLRQKIRDFENNFFVDSVKNYKIINSNSKISVIKSPEYSISTLIKLWKNNDEDKIQ